MSISLLKNAVHPTKNRPPFPGAGLTVFRRPLHPAQRRFIFPLQRESHASLDASDGIRQSPRGESDTDPTFGESGTQLRLNWEAKNRR